MGGEVAFPLRSVGVMKLFHEYIAILRLSEKSGKELMGEK
jgi:hypothetical protein